MQEEKYPNFNLSHNHMSDWTEEEKDQVLGVDIPNIILMMTSMNPAPDVS